MIGDVEVLDLLVFTQIPRLTVLVSCLTLLCNNIKNVKWDSCMQ